MEAKTMLRERRSVRRFSQEKVSGDIMREIIETSSFAPSWANFQIVRYNVIEDEELKNKISKECYNGNKGNMATLDNATGAVVISYVEGKSGHAPTGEVVTAKKETWSMFDAGISAQQFCLAAYEKGVGTVMQGLFDEKKIAEIIGLPENEIASIVIPYGYVENHPNTPPRKSIEEIARFK